MGSQESLHFLREFAPKRKALNDAIKFVPHYHVFGMQSTTDYNNLCTDNSAQFCAEDPDGSGPITGADVLDEDIRQLCIHQLYKKARDDKVLVGHSANQVEYADEYWNYVEKLFDACPLDGPDPEKRFGKVCSENLMRKNGIDVQKVEDCAFRTRQDKLQVQRENTAWSPRALRINGWRYSGALDADLVTRAICAGFIHQPPACKALTEPVMKVLEEIQVPTGGIGFGSFFTSLLVVVCLAMAALMFYKRSLTQHIHSTLREEVMLEVQTQMADYAQLQDGPDHSQSRTLSF